MSSMTMESMLRSGALSRTCGWIAALFGIITLISGLWFGLSVHLLIQEQGPKLGDSASLSAPVFFFVTLFFVQWFVVFLMLSILGVMAYTILDQE